MSAMSRLPAFFLALTFALPGCALVMARQDFGPADFSMAYIRPASRAEAPTVAGRAVSEELKGFERAFGRVAAAVKDLPGAEAAKVRGQATAVRTLLARDWRARLTTLAASQGDAFSRLVLAHDVIGGAGHVPVARAPGDDADSRTANAALAEADLAVKAATRAEATGALSRNMLSLARQDLEEARMTPSPVQSAAAAYAALVAARLALDALHDTAGALTQLGAAERRLAAAAMANTTVGMRLGGAPNRIASAKSALTSLRAGMPAVLEGAARVMADARAMKG